MDRPRSLCCCEDAKVSQLHFLSARRSKYKHRLPCTVATLPALIVKCEAFSQLSAAQDKRNSASITSIFCDLARLPFASGAPLIQACLQGNDKVHRSSTWPCCVGRPGGPAQSTAHLAGPGGRGVEDTQLLRGGQRCVEGRRHQRPHPLRLLHCRQPAPPPQHIAHCTPPPSDGQLLPQRSVRAHTF